MIDVAMQVMTDMAIKENKVIERGHSSRGDYRQNDHGRGNDKGRDRH